MIFVRVAAIVVLLALPSAALAEPGTQTVSLGLGYATFDIPDHHPDGTAVALDYELGIADVVMLRVSAGGSLYFADQKNYSGIGTVGLTYHLDVTRIIPFASVAAGGIVLGGGELDTNLCALVEVAVGADFAHSRRLSYGVIIRSETFLTAVSYFSVAARISWRL